MKTPRKCLACRTAYAYLIKAKFWDQTGTVIKIDDLNEVCADCFVSRVLNRRMGMTVNLSVADISIAKRPASYEVP